MICLHGAELFTLRKEVKDMSGRYIDADALKEQMLKYGFRSVDLTVTEFVEDTLPTADVRENVRGRATWVQDEDDENLFHLQCSICHGGMFEGNAFCPNCGADLRGDTDDMIQMTREEAIKDIRENIKPVVGGKSLDMAIEALEHLENIEAYMHDFDVAEEEAIEALERKKGEWILQDDRTRKLYGWYKCSECGAIIGQTTNFCSECGADMRERRDDERNI